MTGMSVRSREPVSRRGGPARPALSRAAIVAAALAIADRDGLDAVSMRRVAEELDTGASALYVYIENRDDLLGAMFDHAMAPVAEATAPDGDWSGSMIDYNVRAERMGWLPSAPRRSGRTRRAASTRPPRRSRREGRTALARRGRCPGS